MDTKRRERFALVAAGHRFLTHASPLQSTESLLALTTFLVAVERSSLGPADIDTVLLRCLAMLDRQGPRRIPSLVDRYLSAGNTTASSGPARFKQCVEEVLRYGRICDGSVQEAIEMIRTRHADPTISPPSIARGLGMRLSTLGVLFKRETGLTLTEQLRNVRLEQAALLLSTTGKLVKEVWIEVGYKHASTFDHDFKRRFSVNPREFRMNTMRPIAQEFYRQPAVTTGLSGQANSSTRPTDVLVVDDDELTRAVLQTHLRHEGYSVSLAASATEGLAELQRASPDVVLLDYRLDGLDGIDFLRMLRRDLPSKVPGIALFTADWDVFDRVEEIHALGAIVASKLCDLERVSELVAYLASIDFPSPGSGDNGVRFF